MVLDKGGYYPLTFSMYYVDELSEELKHFNVGCNLNGHLINHIKYAGDLVLISPSSAGLSQLLRECEKFGTRHDVKYNAKKSAVIQIDYFERMYYSQL